VDGLEISLAAAHDKPARAYAGLTMLGPVAVDPPTRRGNQATIAMRVKDRLP